MNEELQKLYEAVSKNFDIGSYEEFSSKMGDVDSRKRFYNAISSKFDIGDYESYESRLSSNMTPEEPKKENTVGASASPSVSTSSTSDSSQQSSLLQTGQNDSEYNPDKDGVLSSLEDGGLAYKEKAIKELTRGKEGQSFNFTDADITQTALWLKQADDLKNAEKDKVDKDLKKYEESGFLSDTWNKVKANSLDLVRGVAGLPNWLNEQLFTITASDEELETLNKLQPEQREVVINSIMGAGTPQGNLGQASAEAKNYLGKVVKEIRKDVTQYDRSIGEDIADGNYMKAASRLSSEGIGALPQLVAAATGVGLAAVGISAAVNKQDELEEEGYGLGLDTSLNSTINGVTTALFEKYTGKLANKTWASLKGVPKEGVETFFKGMYTNLIKNPAKEGLSEVGEEIVTDLSDAFVQGKKDVFDDAFKRYTDTFLVGAVVGQKVGLVTQTANTVRTVKEGIRISEMVGDSSNDYNDVSDIFNPNNKKISKDELIVSAMGSSSNKLSNTIKKKVKNGEITEDQGTEIERRFSEVSGALKKTQGIKMNDDTRVKVANKIQQKNKLEEKIKTLDKTLAEPLIEKVNKINEDIKTLINTKQDTNTKKEDNNVEPQSKEETQPVDDNVQVEEETKINEGQVEETQNNEVDTEVAKKAYERVEQSANKSREQVDSKSSPFKFKIREKVDKMIDKLVDRQGSVKRALKKIGAEKVVDYMVTSSGASARANMKANKAYKETFEGLTNNEIKEVENLIFLERIVAIENNRESRGLEPIKHQDGITREDAKLAIEGMKQKLGEESFNKLKQKSDNFFKEYKQVLKDMKDNGLITEQVYDSLAEINYQPTVYLDFLQDMDDNLLTREIEGLESLPLSKEQIKTIKGGHEGSQLMDSWYLLQKSILARSKAIFANRLNNTFVTEYAKIKNEVEALKSKENLTKEEKAKLENFEKVSSNIKEDTVVGYTEAGNPKYKMDGQKTKGYSPLYYYKDGVKHRIWMKEEFFNKFTDANNKYLNSDIKETVALASGTAFVKTLATGNNPLFFLTNTPRDFLFTLTFSKEYGNEVISNTIKLTSDLIKGVKSVVKEDSNYEKYIEYGGGMDYLAVQGKYKNKGFGKAVVDMVMNQKTQDAITNNRAKRFLDKFNLASEMGMRIAVFNRSIKNQLKDLGVKDIKDLDKQQQDDVYTKAVVSARELTDFNQGGKLTKALDAAVPYLNASVQGTRAAVNNLKERPVETMARMAQVTAYTTGAMVTASLSAISYFRGEDEEGMTNTEIYLETLKGVSKYDLQNYFIVPLGKKDKKGNWRYLRLAKSQALTPMLNTSEYYIRKSLAKSAGSDYQEDLGEMLHETVSSNLLPLDPNPLKNVSRVPLVDATFAWNGIDAYTGNPLSWKRGKIPEELEGYVDGRTEPVFRTLGDKFGVSPVRLQNALESFITNPDTNPYIGIGYAIGNSTIGNKLFENEKETALNDIMKSASKRLVKSTSEYNEVAKLKKRVSKESLEAYKKHLVLEKKVKNLVKSYKEGEDVKEVTNNLKTLALENPDEVKRVKAWIKSEVGKKPSNPFVSSLKYQRNKEVRAIMLAERFGNSILDHKNLEGNDKRVFKLLVQNKVIDKETLNYYKKLVE